MPYESPQFKNTLTIHDGNYLDFVSGNGAIVNGKRMSTGLELRQGRQCEAVLKPFDLPLIPESEWEDRIQEMDRDKSSLDDTMVQNGVKIKNQDGWGYCWVFGTTLSLEAARAMQGQKYVELSASSAGLIIKNYSNQGGWGMEALGELSKRGCCPVSMWPEVPSGASVRENPQIVAEKLKYRVLEWYELKTWQELMTCLLLRIGVSTGHNWWGHQIFQARPISKDKTLIWNSWSESWGDNGKGVLVRSKAEPDDVAVAPRVIAFVGDDGQEYQCETYRAAA